MVTALDQSKGLCQYSAQCGVQATMTTATGMRRTKQQ